MVHHTMMDVLLCHQQVMQPLLLDNASIVASDAYNEYSSLFWRLGMTKAAELAKIG